MKNLKRPLAAVSGLAAMALLAISAGVDAAPPAPGTAPGTAPLIGNTISAATYVSTGANATVKGDIVAGTYLTAGALATVTGSTLMTLPSAVTEGPPGGLGNLAAGVTYQSGIYDITGLLSYAANTTIYLDANNAPGDFVLNVSGYINFGAGVKVVMQNVHHRHPPRVFWNAGGYVSVGAGTDVLGSVLANGYVSTGANSTVIGADGLCGGAIYSLSSYVSVGAGASVGTGNLCGADDTPAFGKTPVMSN
jgi:hypothetical protein